MKPIIREYRDSDHSWVLSTAGAIPAPRKNAIAYLEHVLAMHECAIVSCDVDDDLCVALLMCDRETNTILWAFTKSPYRKMGLFKRLCEHFSIGEKAHFVFSTEDASWKRMLRRKKQWTKNPLALFR
jgi:hypothetical protein